jgi:hypothetical protein
MSANYSLEEMREAVFCKKLDKLAYSEAGSLKRNIQKAVARNTSDPELRRVVSDCIKANSFPADVVKRVIAMLPRDKRLMLPDTPATPAAPTVPKIDPEYTKEVVKHFYERELQRSGGLSPFDKIRHEDGHGEWWDARELQGLLGYETWQRFETAIMRAMESVGTNGFTPGHHFSGFAKMVPTGSGAFREVPDYRLSRHACQLIAMNGDSSKPEIAAAQAYFSIQTRRAELQDAGASPIERTEAITKLMSGQDEIKDGISDLGESIEARAKHLEVMIQSAVSNAVSTAVAEVLKGITKGQAKPDADLKGRWGSLYSSVLEHKYKYPDGIHCPCCNVPTTKWEVDHWGNKTNPARRNGWKICSSCNAELGPAGDMKKRGAYLSKFEAFHVMCDDIEDWKRGQTTQLTIL